MKKTLLCLAAVLLLGAGCTSSFPFFTLAQQTQVPSPSPTEVTPTPTSTPPTVPAGWRTYENVLHGFSFSYPEGAVWNMGGYNLDDTPASFDLGTQVTATSVQSVPTTELAVRIIPASDPRIKNCFFSESRWPEDANGIVTSHLTLGGRDVCLAVEQDAGAGNYYSSYAYTIAHGDEYIVLNFVVHSVNCLNYEDPATQCVAFDEARDTKGFADIVGTLGFTGNAPKTQLDISLFKETTKEDKTKVREISLSYPHLDGYSDATVQAAFNTLVDAKVNATVAQFKTDAGEVSAEELDSALGPWTLFLDYQVYPAPKGRVSLGIRPEQLAIVAEGAAPSVGVVNSTRMRTPVAVRSTMNSESPYASIFGRWWALCASSTARSCRSKHCCTRCIRASSGSYRPSHTKVPSRRSICGISSSLMSPSRRPSA